MYTKFQIVTASFVMSVHPFAWNNLAVTGQIFMAFILRIFRKAVDSSFVTI